MIDQNDMRKPVGLSSEERSEMDEFLQNSPDVDAPAEPEPPKTPKEYKEVEANTEDLFTTTAFGTGVFKGYQSAGNLVIEAADATENFLAEKGFLDRDDRITSDSRLTFADDPSNFFQPETATQEFVQTLGSFVGFGGPLGAATKGIKAVGTFAKFAKATTLGAITDFAALDPEDGRLTDLLVKYPLFQDIGLEFLASNPKDTKIEGRFKNALEGMILGGGIEAGLRGGSKLIEATVSRFKAIRANRVADNILKDSNEMVKKADEIDFTVPEATDEIVGEDLAKMKKIKAEVKAERATQKPQPVDVIGESKKELNSTLKEVDEIEFTVNKELKELQQKGLTDLEILSRGTVTDEEVVAGAKALGLTPEEFLQTPIGRAANAETKAKAEMFVKESSDKVAEAVKEYRADKGSKESSAKLISKIQNHIALSNRLSAVKTEIGRSLRDNKLGVSSQNRRIDELIKMYGGDAGIDKLADSIENVLKNPEDLALAMKNSRGRNFVDALVEMNVNRMLGGMGTHVYNFVSNTGQLGLFLAETGVTEASSLIAKSIGKSGALESAVKGETEVVAHAMLDSIGMAFRASRETMVTGKSQFKRAQKFEYRRAITPESMGLDESNNFLFKGVKYLGTVVNVPVKFLESGDEFFKVILNNAKKKQLAYRAGFKAQIEQGLSEKQTSEFIEDFMQKGKGEHAALETAKEFTNTRNLEDLKPIVGKFTPELVDEFVRTTPLSKLVTPFTKFAANQVDFVVARTPFAKDLAADLAAGGLRRDSAIGRVGVGSMVMMGGGYLATQGVVTGEGPTDRSAKNTLRKSAGWKDKSFRFGKIKMDLKRMGPLGEILTMGATLAEIGGAFTRDHADKYSELLLRSTALLVTTHSPEFLTENFMGFWTAVSEGDERGVERFLGNIVPSAKGPTGLFADPVARSTRSDPNSMIPIFDKMVRSFKAGVPGLSDDLPPIRNFFGQARTVISFRDDPDELVLADKDSSLSPFMKEVERFNLTGPNVIEGDASNEYLKLTMPQRHIKIGGRTIKLSPEKYDKFQLLSAGHDLEFNPYGDKTLKETLDSEVSGGYPSIIGDATDIKKIQSLKDIIKNYRASARAQLRADPDIYEQIQDIGGDETSSTSTGNINLSL